MTRTEKFRQASFATIEAALPHVQVVLRQVVERNEKRPGAPRLRMMLAAFDG